MPFSLRKLTKIHFTAICLIGLIGIVVLALSGRNLVAGSAITKQEIKAASNKVMPPLQKDVKKTKEVITVKLSPEGFFPSEVLIPKQPFVLVINNRTGTREVNFNLFREKSNDKLQERKLKQETMSLQWELDLPSGNYELRELNNPKWVLFFCILEI